MRRPPILATALALALLSACDAADIVEPEVAQLSEDPLAPVLASASGNRDGRDGGGSSLFDELAGKITSFGGLYRTGPCAVAVVLTDMSEEKHALQVVHAALAPLVAKPCPGGVQVTAVPGQFTYLELKRYLAASQELLQIDGVRGAKIDYQLNKLVIIVASRRAAQAVLEALPRLGIPAAAVAFQVGEGGGDRGGRTGSTSSSGSTRRGG